MAERETAPPNSLPTWSECALIIDNAAFRVRAAAGLEGSVLDTPPTTPEPTELHRFIYEYDDADPYRSAWFMHRLELVLNEARTPSTPLQHPSTRPSSVEGGEANTCKLTECQGKPRCEKCLTMDRAYGVGIPQPGQENDRA